MDTIIGIIGGSGLDNPDIFTDAYDEIVTTPWGDPSAPLRRGMIKGVPVAMLGRHGREHTITPSKVNYRANIAALQSVGCSCIVATTAVGSLREEIGRGDLVIIDQCIDFTKQRAMTFHDSFEPHAPMHVGMADPFDADLSKLVVEACKALKLRHHPTGTLVTIEGPRFSTRAESHMFRSWGADIINMSVATEVALAREAGIPYVAIAMSTDYDCWKLDEEPVSWESALAVFKANAANVTNLLMDVIPQIAKR